MARTIHGDIRQRILDAAEERVWHYGLKKTTIDEIAADAGVGKGTVYLYFDSKKEIALAIIGQYKMDSLAQVQAIARDRDKDPVQRLKEMLAHPVIGAHERCAKSPAAMEVVAAVRPHIQARMRPYLEQEIALIAEVLEEGNQQGIFSVEDTMQTARTLKYMCAGFAPPYPCVPIVGEIRLEIDRTVDLAARGLRKHNESRHDEAHQEIGHAK